MNAIEKQLFLVLALLTLLLACDRENRLYEVERGYVHTGLSVGSVFNISSENYNEKPANHSEEIANAFEAMKGKVNEGKDSNGCYLRAYYVNDDSLSVSDKELFVDGIRALREKLNETETKVGNAQSSYDWVELALYRKLIPITSQAGWRGGVVLSKQDLLDPKLSDKQLLTRTRIINYKTTVERGLDVINWHWTKERGQEPKTKLTR